MVSESKKCNGILKVYMKGIKGAPNCHLEVAEWSPTFSSTRSDRNNGINGRQRVTEWMFVRHHSWMYSRNFTVKADDAPLSIEVEAPANFKWIVGVSSPQTTTVAWQRATVSPQMHSTPSKASAAFENVDRSSHPRDILLDTTANASNAVCNTDIRHGERE